MTGVLSAGGSAWSRRRPFLRIIGLVQAILVGAGFDIGHARVQAGFLIVRADIDGHSLGGILHCGVDSKRASSDDGGAELGIERDQVDAGLNVFREWVTRQTRPRR